MRLAEFSVAEQIGKVGELLHEHWDELATDKRLMVLEPHVELYLAIERAGRCLAIGAFDGDAMFGYSVSFVGPHPHYAGLVVAQNDVLFVSKARRDGPAGLRLIRETERLAHERGAGLMVWHGKPGTAFDRVMPRLGYRVQDILYSRALTWDSSSEALPPQSRPTAQ